ncbi:MAG: DNRLRE domain-containing protein [Candidatus Thermoplasmatota archaeon]
MKKIGIAIAIFYIFFSSATATQAGELTGLYDKTTNEISEISLTAIADSYIRSSFPDMNFDNCNLYVRPASSGYDEYRAFIKFDLSSIQSNATIISAELSLKEIGSGSGWSTRIFSVYPLTSSWEETKITWNNQPSYDNGIYASATVKPIATKALYDSWNITKIVQGWVSGTKQNYGIIVKDSTVSSKLRPPEEKVYKDRVDIAWTVPYKPTIKVTYKLSSTIRFIETTVIRDNQVEIVNRLLNSNDIILVGKKTDLANKVTVTNRRSVGAPSLAGIQELIDLKVNAEFIGYDLEAWNLTPKEEQADPLSSIAKAVEMVHKAGYKFIWAGGIKGVADGNNASQIAALLKEGDRYHYQTQYKVRDPATFRDNVYPVYSAVKSINPNILFSIQVSCNPNIHFQTIENNTKSVESVKDFVDGVTVFYWGKEEQLSSVISAYR